VNDLGEKTVKTTIQHFLALLLISTVVVTACGAQLAPTPVTEEPASGGLIYGQATVETLDESKSRMRGEP
jgi:hypothetical protein